MNFTFLGHACFTIEFGAKTLLFDPFISGNPMAKEHGIDVDRIQADYILISHAHADHLLDAVSIAKRCEATVVCSYEVHEWLLKQGVAKTHPMNIGGRWGFGDFSVKCVVAHHSSGLPDGSYGGSPMGFLVFADNKQIYYSGDTSLTLDMQLIPRWATLDCAILPLGDNFTMGVSDAVLAAEFAGAKRVIGVHYDTFGYIVIDKEGALQQFNDAGIVLELPKIGGTVTL
jgi:L-ascorbate metabolism protein UlaG (beta-lactamase superfamily)